MANLIVFRQFLALLWLLGSILATCAVGRNGPETLPPRRVPDVVAAGPALPATLTGVRALSADELIPSATTAGRAHPLALEPVGSLYGIAWTVAVSGTMAYVAMGDVLNVIDVSIPTQPVRRSSLAMPV